MRGFSKAHLIAMAIAVSVTAIGAIVAETVLRHHVIEHAQAQSARTLNGLRSRLLRDLYGTLSAVNGLASHVAVDPDLDEAAFARFADVLMQRNPRLRLVAGAPDLVIRHMHPLAGNEAAIGVDYRALPEQRDAALRAARARAGVIAGPVALVQGGFGFIARAPVFVPGRAGEEERFWGIVAAVMDRDALYAHAGLEQGAAAGLDIAIRGTDGLGAFGDVFYGDPALFESDAVIATLDLPHGEWLLAARPPDGWPAPTWLQLAALRGGALALMISVVLLLASRARFQRERRKVEKAALDSEASFRSLFDNANDGMFINDAESLAILDVNRQVERYLGYSREELLAMTVRDIYEGQDSRELERVRKLACDSGSAIFEAVHRHRDGSLVPVEVSTKLVTQGERNLFLSVVRDISERKRIESALKRSQQDLVNAIESISEGFTLWDTEDRLRVFNDRFLAITPALRDEISAGMTFEALVRATAAKGLVQATADPESWIAERIRQHRSHDSLIELKTLSGRHIRISEHKTSEGHTVGIYTDVTEIKEAEEHIRFRAYYDALTELPNRENFMNQLASTIRMSERTNAQSALMFVDLDRFKNINDTMGHETGDLLLQEAAKRICECVRQTDTVARFGGDEFTVILRHIDDVMNAARVAETIIDKLSQGYQLGGHLFYSGASVGITICPIDSNDPQVMLRNADMAMYQAKAKGRNTYQFFTSAMTDRAEHFVALEKDLRRSIGGDEFDLHYQPVIRLDDESLGGAEALLRWSHPVRGSVPPDEFIPVAEETRLIIDLGAWAIRHACERGSAWCDAPGMTLPHLAVNVSCRQFYGGFDAAFLGGILEQTGFPPDRLVLEMTESLLIEEDDRISKTLGKFRDLGVGIAVDDFGTGYSALSYLRQFPVTTLKVDRAFVRHIDSDPADAKLVESIVAMARALSITVVAEGVETRAQAELLRDMGCGYAQGYLYGKPVTSETFESRYLVVPERRVRAV